MLGAEAGRGLAEFVPARSPRIRASYIEDRFITDEGRLDTAAMRPVARLGYDEFSVVEGAFRMERPDAIVVTDGRSRSS